MTSYYLPGASRFFVYVHMRPDGSPFYVGKGVLARALSKAGRSQHYRNVIAKHGTDKIAVRLLTPLLPEIAAFVVEVSALDFYRSSGARLVNRTFGGEGVRALKITAQWRARMSAAAKLRFKDPAQVAIVTAHAKGNKYNLGTRYNAKARAKISAKSRAMWADPQLRAKLLASHKAARAKRIAL